MKSIIVGLCIASYLFNTDVYGKTQTLPQSTEVLSTILKVNNNWQLGNPQHGRAFWDNAAYHTGNIEVYKITGNDDYLEFSKEWAEYNSWMGAKSDNPKEWKYSYGETDEYVLFGDWQICFQTYIDIYNYIQNPHEKMIIRAKEVMDYQISTNSVDYLWWADGLYMVMPVLTKLYKLTNDERYLDKLFDYYTYSKSIMYDEVTGLFFRDAKYVYPKHKSINGKKDFWARGNGWVFAGLAKVLQDLPENYENYNTFRDDFIIMAKKLKNIQKPEGYWTRSMLDSEHAPGPETSGTAFFTYGILWGLNNNILSVEDYLPTIENSWKFLVDIALQDDGSIGYVQPIGERAIPGQIVSQHSVSNFGTGAFLLAAAEMYRFVKNNNIN